MTPPHERRRRASWIRGALAALSGVALLAVAGAAPAGEPWPAQPQGPAWPPPPDIARVTYVTAIHEPGDIGAGPSLMGRLWGALAGRSKQPGILRARGLTTDSAGRLLVADTEQQMVHVFDPARRRYSYLEPAPFLSPVGVATGPDGTIYVSDSGRRRVFAYSPDGRLLATLGVVNGEPLFVRPTGIAVGPDGLVYVVDTAAGSILALNPTGRVERTIGRTGTEPGQFNFPTDLVIGADGRLYVTDALNARVQVLEANGLFVTAFGQRGNGSGDFDKPKGIALDPDGHIYVVESLHDVFQVFDIQGRLLLAVGGTGAGPGQLSLPSGIHIDRNGRIFVADSLNGRIQVFQYVSEADAR